MRNPPSLRLLVSVALAGCGVPGEPAAVRQELGQSEPITVPDNPSCASLGLTSEYHKVEPPVSGQYDIDGFNSVTLNLATDGRTLTWSASLGVDAVIIKGGDDANLYLYTPEHGSSSGWPALHAPVDPATGTYYAVSHVEFCFDYEVDVWKTARTSLERTHRWSIDKGSAVAELVLSAGQIIDVDYWVDLAATHTDAGHRVSGEIQLFNPAPFAAEITDVTDLLGDIPVPLACPVVFPYSLAPLATLTCTYDTAVPDASPRTNVVVASTSGRVGSGEFSVLVDFTAPELESIDECATVSDDRRGPLGTYCAPGPHHVTYTTAVGPYECGEHAFGNVASFVTDDLGATGDASWTVQVSVPCPLGCTLTHGYWKNHSEQGPARYDDTWALLSAGADTAFYLSGKTYLEVLWTAPLGNPYYLLARAYIAAELNQLNGAAAGAISDAYPAAMQVFAQYTPSMVGALPRNSELRTWIITLAGTLDDYDNGLIGPGHCDE